MIFLGNICGKKDLFDLRCISDYGHSIRTFSLRSKSGLRKNFKELLNEIERRQERSLQREPLLSSNFMDRVSDVSVKRPWEMSARKLVFFFRILRSGQLGLYIKAASSFWLWHHKEKSVNKLVPSLLLRRSSFVVPDHRALALAFLRQQQSMDLLL